MTAMCKFKVGDHVRVIDPADEYHDETGTVFARDPDAYYCYDVVFESGDITFYPAHALVLAPGESE